MITHRALPSLACLLLLGLLTGCSVLSIAYDYADWIVLWRLDHYFNTSPEQEEYLQDRVGRLHQWHRTQELPLYADFLRHIQEEVKIGLSPESLETLWRDYQDLRAHLAEQLAFHGAQFLLNLQTEQHAYFRTVLQQENQALRKEVGDTPEERVMHRIDSVLDILEFWVGNVTIEQVAAVKSFMQHFPDTTQEYLLYREFRQQQLLDILAQVKDATLIEHHVARWMNASGQDNASPYSEGVQRWQDAVKRVIIHIDHILTPRQRHHAVKKLQQFIDELDRLSHA